MYNKLTLAGCLFFGCILQSFSQGQNNNWHFGLNSNISFNSGNPVALPGSQIGTAECAASISDNAGNLLFYTNGETIFNSAHAAMPNGTGLLGWDDVQQGALIVPKPSSTNLYYVFTIGNPMGAFTKEFRYSIVDMSLNGGLGNVITKNILLDSNVTEKLTATKHQNGTDFWVVEKNFNTNEYKSYLLSSAGITSPVISAGGAPIEMGDFTGAIKITGNGCWLVSSTRGGFGNPGLIELFHFNNQTGAITDGAVTTLIGHPYGLEFSPDNSKLYVGENDAKPINQFNMNAGSASQVLASLIPISGIVESYSMLAAPDGKIYLLRSYPGYSFTNSLAIIENPNAAGIACNLNLAGFYSPLIYNTSSLPNNFSLTYSGSLNSCSIIPVSWLYFHAARFNKGALLDWATTAEVNTKLFEVEASSNGSEYEIIGSVPARGTNGTTQTYSFTDPDIYAYKVKVINYRLKQIDIDGKFTYSKVAAVRVDDKSAPGFVNAYPNPFTKSISLSVIAGLPEDKINHVELYTITGKLIYTKKVSQQWNNNISLTDLQQLPNGIYFLKTFVRNRAFIVKMIK